MSARSVGALFVVGVCYVGARAAEPPTRVVVVIEENKSFTQVIGSPHAPYLNGLAAAGATFTSFYAITHPSQPNYLEFFSGDAQGVTDNSFPVGVPFATANLGAALIAAGHGFAGYCEDLPEAGSQVEESGAYVRKHNPWANWQNEPVGMNQLGAETNVPFSAFPSEFAELATVSMVVPNLDNDMHDGTVAQGDAWLETNIGPFAAWAMENNGLLIITFDEDNTAARNRIPTVMYGPMIRAGSVIDSTWTLHNLLRTIEEMYGTTHAGAAGKVRRIVGPFETDQATVTKRFQHGADGYTGAVDGWIEASAPDTAHASEGLLVTDGSPASQALIRFEGVFSGVGGGGGGVPAGAEIVSAKLLLLTGPASGNNTLDEMSLHRMLVAWDGTPTWNELGWGGGGVQADGVEAAADAEFTLGPDELGHWAIFDVSDAVQAWSDDPGSNFGFAVLGTGTDGWRAVSSEGSVAGDRPMLEVTYACRADWNRDGVVGAFDYDDFVSGFFEYLVSGAGFPDYNGDTVVDAFDYDDFVSDFFTGCG